MESTQNQASIVEAELQEFLLRNPCQNPKKPQVNIDKVRESHPELSRALVANATKYYPVIKAYYENLILAEEQRSRSYMSKNEHFHVGFIGNLGDNFVTMKGLRSSLANQLVGIHGLITRTEATQSYLEKSVHYCPNTKSHEVKEYLDYFNFEEFSGKKNNFILKFDQNKNPLVFQAGNSSFKNTQKCTIQELPEKAHSGQLPISVPILFQNDLCDKFKAGDKVESIGIYMLVPNPRTKLTGIFNRYFYCLSIKALKQTVILKKPKKSNFPKPQDRYRICSNSIAPSIHGHQMIKKAILLMLVGGVEKNVNNTHFRGDINVLLVGDPGTAKSQMLRYVLSNYERAIGTTGSGASGVGLTASIITDSLTKEKYLEAGAMVLADRGIVCIDQFDKMNESDRVAIHEAMEQQTITINKAGLSSCLNARCSVLAAANPTYGEYQETLPLDRNIGMQSSLLSRFDLVFVIKDKKDRDTDLMIAKRVTQNHMIGKIMDTGVENDDEDLSYIISPIDSNQVEENVYENKIKMDHKNQVLTQKALKDYIEKCKVLRPLISEEASSLISQMFRFLRESQLEGQISKASHVQIMPISVRLCETLIRLSEAHAKLRESTYVEIQDCSEAFRLISYCLTESCDSFQDHLQAMIKESRIVAGNYEAEEDSEERKIETKSRKSTKKSEKIEKQSSKGRTQKAEKIEIKSSKKETEQMFKELSIGEEQKLKSAVFVQVSKMAQRIRGQKKIKCSDLIRSVLEKHSEYAESQVQKALEQLEKSGKLTLQGDKGNETIYL